MAGVTDKPFRQLCKQLGAGLAASEMTASDPRLWTTRKSLMRMDHAGEPDPVSVQIAGYDPAMLAEAARYNVGHGAQIIDINMGCPAKKVCNVYSGSALLQDERLVARIAEDSGIAALAVHGRTRADLYQGEAEYETIAAIKAAIRIPVFANGDIDSPEKARAVLDATGADAVMIGRAAQGRPWIFREVAHHLATGEKLAPPSPGVVGDILCGHLADLYAFHGELPGVRIARKHLGWYAKDRPENAAFRAVVNRTECAREQLRLTREYFDALAAGEELRVAA
jgi:tRNA-dihydrouridine synthase B